MGLIVFMVRWVIILSACGTNCSKYVVLCMQGVPIPHRPVVIIVQPFWFCCLLSWIYAYRKLLNIFGETLGVYNATDDYPPALHFKSIICCKLYSPHKFTSDSLAIRLWLGREPRHYSRGSYSFVHQVHLVGRCVSAGKVTVLGGPLATLFTRSVLLIYIM